MEQLLTVEEVSDLTRIPANTLKYWRHTGTGPKSARIGRRILYRQSEVMTWIDDQFAGDRDSA